MDRAKPEPCFNISETIQTYEQSKIVHDWIEEFFTQVNYMYGYSYVH